MKLKLFKRRKVKRRLKLLKVLFSQHTEVYRFNENWLILEYSPPNIFVAETYKRYDLKKAKEVSAEVYIKEHEHLFKEVKNFIDNLTALRRKEFDKKIEKLYN